MPSAPFTPSPSPRKDNLFGVCHAVGDAFGFDPFLLRVGLAIALILRPEAVLIGYAVTGVLVLTSRIVVRQPRLRRPAATVVAHVGAAEPVAVSEPMAIAA